MVEVGGGLDSDTGMLLVPVVLGGPGSGPGLAEQTRGVRQQNVWEYPKHDLHRKSE